MQGLVDTKSPEGMERLRDAVRTRLACDLAVEHAGGVPPNPAGAFILPPAVTPEQTAALEADEAEIDRVIAAMGQDAARDVLISHELARYLCRTLDAAARFAEKMPLYVHRQDVGTWAADVKVSSTEAATSLRRAVMAAALPTEDAA